MAEVLGDFQFSRGRHKAYPWDEWADGRTWRVVHGTDFTISPMIFRNSVYVAARSRGMRARVSVKGDAVVFQFYDPKSE